MDVGMSGVLSWLLLLCLKGIDQNTIQLPFLLFGGMDFFGKGKNNLPIGPSTNNKYNPVEIKLEISK